MAKYKVQSDILNKFFDEDAEDSASSDELSENDDKYEIQDRGSSNDSSSVTSDLSDISLSENKQS